MSDRLRQLVTWTLLTTVTLVGGLGTGLHGLLGCEHGASGVCAASCCTAPDASSSQPSQKCCAFCRRAAEKEAASRSADVDRRVATVTAAGCDGCLVCDLLAQYHTAAPLQLDSLSIELASGEAAIQRQNAVVAAAIRLALSRGPPAV